MTVSKGSSEHNVLKAYNMMLYFAGTMIMWDPSNECIHDFWSGGMVKNLPLSSRNPGFIKAASQLRESAGDTASSYEIMKNDFLNLFGGKGVPLAAPYETFYQDTDRIINGKNNGLVSDFYKSYGWESRFRDQIPDDHLGIELLFLTLMIEKYLELDDEVCCREMKHEIARFLNQHILSWVPRWNEDVQKNALSLGYKGIGTLIQACAEDIRDMMNEG
jgi:putative dimethyl sulfoxide reductase chaperone